MQKIHKPPAFFPLISKRVKCGILKGSHCQAFLNKWCSSSFKSMSQSKYADRTIEADNSTLIQLKLFCKASAKHWGERISGEKCFAGTGSINICYHNSIYNNEGKHTPFNKECLLKRYLKLCLPLHIIGSIILLHFSPSETDGKDKSTLQEGWLSL